MIESGPQSGAPRRGDAPVPSSPADTPSTVPPATVPPATTPTATPAATSAATSTATPAAASTATPAAGRTTDPPSPDLGSWLAAWQPEDAPLLHARQRAREVGVGAVDEATGAALRLLAALSGARHAVELGTGAGVSTLWLLGGLHPDGVLTSIDSEPEHQRLARQSLTEAGVPSGRVRLIAGRALEVLPRLSDGGYDLVLCDASTAGAVDYLPAALRLLRLGGVVVFTGALAGGRIADPSARDPEALAARELARAVREEPRLIPAVLPVGAGLLVAVTRVAPDS